MHVRCMLLALLCAIVGIPVAPTCSDAHLHQQAHPLLSHTLFSLPSYSTHQLTTTASPLADMMQRPTILLLVASFTAPATAFTNPYPYTHTNCGIEQTINDTPQKVITMNQGATEFMLAMGLQNNIAGTRAVSDVDPIWPRYKEAYETIPKIPKLPDTEGSYPTDEQMINQYKADFIFASWRSAFREYEPPRQNAEDTDKSKGVWSNKTGIGPCDGENSDWWTAAGVNSTYNETNLHGYSTCRSQLHAKGINTWLEPVSCEDPELRKPGTPETVYEAITTLGSIFNVPTVAKKLIDDMKNDFKLAEETLKKSAGYSLTAVWLDCVTCCANKTVYPGEWVFVGSGGGAPQLIMQESGLTNVFADRENSWACVKLEEIVASDPDVMIVVDASFDPAMGKIDFMHNHSLFCNTRFVRNADYIRVPFSASTLGPRNGAAALDIVAAALHVITGSMELTAQSGVDFFDPEMLATRTAKLACPVDPSKVRYMKTSYTNCGVRHTLTKTPERVVTVHQGATEFMLAMGLEDKMVGTSAMDDTIWTRYKEAYDQIPILSAGEPTEKMIMDVNADFIVAAYSSAFAEYRQVGDCTFDSCKGIFSNDTIGPCDGENSDYFPAGDKDYKTPYSTCRPQLHDEGIGTWLWEDYCEDPALRPAGGATEHTVYAAVEQLGRIFNVPHVASKVNADIQNDFKVAKEARNKSGIPSLKAVISRPHPTPTRLFIKLTL